MVFFASCSIGFLPCHLLSLGTASRFVAWLRNLVAQHWSSGSSEPVLSVFSLIATLSLTKTILSWARQLSLSSDLRRIQAHCRLQPRDESTYASPPDYLGAIPCGYRPSRKTSEQRCRCRGLRAPVFGQCQVICGTTAGKSARFKNVFGFRMAPNPELRRSGERGHILATYDARRSTRLDMLSVSMPTPNKGALSDGPERAGQACVRSF